MRGEVFYNTASEFFSPLQGEEKYRTTGFNEMALIYGTCELSFRKTADLINRKRYQENDGTPYRTIQNITECEGLKIQKHIEQKSEKIISLSDFSHEIINKEDALELYEPIPSELKKEEYTKIIDDFKIKPSLKSKIANNPVPYESLGNAVNISLDDVGVKEQKEKRSKTEQENIDKNETQRKKRKYIQNTVVHIEHKDRNYMLNGYGIFYVLRLLVAFLIHNNINNIILVFYIDGHGLYSKILQFYYWNKKILIILDWYHLVKKCKELLSMAVCGSKIRNDVLDEILPLLWHGLVDEAISYLKSIASEKIRNKKEIEHLIGYLRKNRGIIPAYSVRAKIGLRNSSNRGEKANDLLVAHRQKKNGMSWSRTGSVSLASITALSKNKEYQKWFDHGEIEFKFAS
ncbi:conserved hypothetical protein [Desulfamplus magnetovallimortis]|uniref:ISKra4 family transposase n=1 Tax=Desulfamplus magnetovallimortis TaxID=1246637 RepID=A0A1W1HFF6_9BACT|nr:UPF0236 family protein [Desulfamplus magnetovallimortis]SLM31217.1 conserved hypothetical protein [Desulfamplus magnetovallimortis]